MLDDMYSRLTEKADYKLLLFLPIIITLLLAVVVYFNGFVLGIDFSGGTWMEVIPSSPLDSKAVDSMSSQLASFGLEDLEVYSGTDIVTGKEKITIITTSQVNQTQMKETFRSYVGELYETDTARVQLESKPASDVMDKIAVRFSADVSYDDAGKVLVIDGFDLDQDKLERVLASYLDPGFVVLLQKKNFNIKPVGETLGRTFRDQGLKAVFVAYLLIVFVIFVAFRDPIPSLAVILAGTCDAVIALGGMSLFGIVLEPASLVALLMLVGYSVDSDILLTTRVLRNKTGTVMDRINDAMKTGLTMTGTTLVVMFVIITLSTFLFQIEILSSIASVLLIGLLGDLMTTWFMNAGILKWYVEERGGKISLRNLRGK